MDLGATDGMFLSLSSIISWKYVPILHRQISERTSKRRDYFILSANNIPELVVSCPNGILWPFRHVCQDFDPRVLFTTVAGKNFQICRIRTIDECSSILPCIIFRGLLQLQACCEDLGSYYHLRIMHWRIENVDICCSHELNNWHSYPVSAYCHDVECADANKTKNWGGCRFDGWRIVMFQPIHDIRRAEANVIQRRGYQRYQVASYQHREVSRPNMGCSYSSNMGVSRIFHYQFLDPLI